MYKLYNQHDAPINKLPKRNFLFITADFNAKNGKNPKEMKTQIAALHIMKKGK